MKDALSLITLSISVASVLLSFLFFKKAKSSFRGAQRAQTDIISSLFKSRDLLAERVLLDYYKDNIGGLNKMRADYPQRSAINWILFAIHTHGELCKPDDTVYMEADIMELFKKLGYETNWGEK